MNAPALSLHAQPLLRLDLDARAMVADWANCDRVANYLARLASFDRSDSFLYSNLLSTVLNELFEIVFCQHHSPGSVRCSLLRAEDSDRIELELPATEAERQFYRSGVAAAQSPQAAERYTDALLVSPEHDRSVGFLELAADYDARIWLDEPPGGDRVRLTVDVRLEDGRHF